MVSYFVLNPFRILFQAQENKLFRFVFGIVHNLSMSDNLVRRLRDVELVPTVQKYLQSPDESRQLDALAILAGK